MSRAGGNYLDQIRAAHSPERAATLVRALATCLAAGLTCYQDAERVTIVLKAERLAQSLERDFDGPKPWKRWLREAGY